MTYRELFYKATRLIDKGEITLGEYDEMTKPLNREIEQQPCDDAISREAALEKMADYVASGYADSAEDFEEYSRIICQLPSITQKPIVCDDAISCEAVIEWLKAKDIIKLSSQEETARKELKALPPVTPQPKTGHWIGDAKTYYEELNKRGLGVDEYTPYFTDDIACSECLAKYSMLDNETQFFKHCPNCGSRMVEPQESEEV